MLRVILISIVMICAGIAFVYMHEENNKKPIIHEVEKTEETPTDSENVVFYDLKPVNGLNQNTPTKTEEAQQPIESKIKLCTTDSDCVSQNKNITDPKVIILKETVKKEQLQESATQEATEKLDNDSIKQLIEKESKNEKAKQARDEIYDLIDDLSETQEKLEKN